MAFKVFISCDQRNQTEVEELSRELVRVGIEYTETENEADVVVLFVTAQFIDPNSHNRIDANRLLEDGFQKLVIALAYKIDPYQIDNQANDQGWDVPMLKKIKATYCITGKNSLEEYAKAINDRRLKPGYNSKFDIFLSHAGEDKEFVRFYLKRVLEDGNICSRSYNCFLDVENLVPGNDVPGGAEQIEIAAANASLGLIVLSDYYTKKRWPIREFKIFCSKSVPIAVIWYKFNKGHADHAIANRPSYIPDDAAYELLQGAVAVNSKFCPNIHYNGEWHKPDKEQYSLDIKQQINIAFPNLGLPQLG